MGQPNCGVLPRVDFAHVFLAGIEGAFNQIIGNEYHAYPLAQGVGGHVDQPSLFGPKVVSLSLGSGASMVFRPAKGSGVTSHPIRILLDPGSLLVLEGPARYKWTHAIPKCSVDKTAEWTYTRTTRVSITLRTLTAQGRKDLYGA